MSAGLGQAPWPLMAPQPRPGIQSISPYVGGESGAPGAAQIIKLSSNESALGANPRAVAAYQAGAGKIDAYPDGGAGALRAALAAHHGIPATQIVCGNGSDDLLHLLMHAYAGPADEVLYSAHGFLVYPLAAHSAGATPVAVPEQGLKADVDGILAHVTPHTRAVFIANPNNPTGSYLTNGEIARLHAGLPPHVLLVIDAAYAEYIAAADYSDGKALVTANSNVVMTRTFSKIYGLAGLRLGWAYCPPAVADVLNRVRGPFNVNSAAQAAGIAALEDQAFVEAARTHNAEWLAWTTQALTALGLTVYPSVANFVLVDFGGADKAEAARLFLKSRGILVRQMGAYHLPNALRITIGRGDQMQAVAAALAAFPA